MTVTVIYGGKSGEHEISLVSAAAVARNIDSKNKVQLIAITKNGRWFLQPDSEYERICKDTKAVLTIKEDPTMAVTIVPAGKKDRGDETAIRALPVEFTAGREMIFRRRSFRLQRNTTSESGSLHPCLFEKLGHLAGIAEGVRQIPDEAYFAEFFRHCHSMEQVADVRFT